MTDQRANVALLCGAAALTTYLGFEAGGFFPDSTAVAAVSVAVLLALRIGLAGSPFGGLSRRSLLAVASLALFAVWTLVSAIWSHAPGRAVVEFNRVLFYLLVLILFASLHRRRGRRIALAGGFGVGSVVLCAAAFATRTLPAVFPVRPELANNRLAFPLTYWNALGLLAVLGILLCLGLSSSERLPRAARAVAAAAVPLLGATLLLTFSRGAIAAGLIGLVVLCATCRSRALLFTLLATAPAAGLAVGAAYSATALAMVDPTGPAAVSQGHNVVLVVALASVAALLLRLLLARWDQPSRRRILPAHLRRALAGLVALVLVAGAAAVSVAFDLPNEVSHQYDRFVLNEQLRSGQPVRDRLLNPANTGRLSTWRVAVSAWRAHSVRGNGAGTYQNEWNRHRDSAGEALNAHSLYLEVLADLGLVGLALLLIGLLTLVAGLAMRVTGPDRGVAASTLAAAVAWLLRAGIDWDWQMPVVTWWLFAAGGLAVARGAKRRAALTAPGRLGRVLGMVGVAGVALLPVQVGLSQRNLTRALSAFRHGDCNAAVGYSLKSSADIGGRAAPFEVLGYCDARDGHPALAVVAIQSAINRDPENWEFRYDMAIVRALSGLDPRSAARRALALNPRSSWAASLNRAMQTSEPRLWRARAARTKLLIT